MLSNHYLIYIGFETVDSPSQLCQLGFPELENNRSFGLN